jgi:hypothetical protein
MNVYNPRDQQCAIGRTEYRNSKCAVNYAHPPPKHKFRMVIDATSVLLMAIIITSSVSAQFWLPSVFWMLWLCVMAFMACSVG